MTAQPKRKRSNVLAFPPTDAELSCAQGNGTHLDCCLLAIGVDTGLGRESICKARGRDGGPCRFYIQGQAHRFYVVPGSRR